MVRASMFVSTILLGAACYQAGPLNAQSRQPNEQICLAHSLDAADQRVSDFVVIVPTSREQALSQRGFRRVPCRGNGRSFRSFQRQVCSLPEAQRGLIDPEIYERYYVHLNEIC